ncbi:MAG: hypothetical protein LC114_21960, partial [Bryobacterales bacterium]|nr:hypothetical protein [Bryobacterales bacterium]
MANRGATVAETVDAVLARWRTERSLSGAAASVAAPKVAEAAEPQTGHGVFTTVDQAVEAASAAQKQLAAMSIEERGRIVSVIRRLCVDHAREWGAMEL